MKIYKKRVVFNIYLFFALILLAVVIVSAAAVILNSGKNAFIPLAVLPLLFVCVFFAFYEKNCSVLLTDKVIYIGHNVFSDEKKYNKASVTITFSDIERVNVTYYRVQGKRPLDENMYTFVLKDGTEVKTFFYEYGEENEKEIIDYVLEKTGNKR